MEYSVIIKGKSTWQEYIQLEYLVRILCKDETVVVHTSLNGKNNR